MSIRIAAFNGRCPCKACQRIRPARGWAARAIERAIEEELIEAPRHRGKAKASR